MINYKEEININCLTGCLKNGFAMNDIVISEEEIFVEGGGVLTVYNRNKIQSNIYDAAMSFLYKNGITVITSEIQNEKLQYDWLIKNIDTAFVIGHINVKYLSYSKLFKNTKTTKYHFINILGITEHRMHIYDGHIPGKIVSTYEGELNTDVNSIYRSKFISVPRKELNNYHFNIEKRKFIIGIIQREIISNNRNIGNNALYLWLEDIKKLISMTDNHQYLSHNLYEITADLVTEGFICSRVLLKNYMIKFWANTEWIQGIDFSLKLLNQIKLIFLKASFSLKKTDIEKGYNTIYILLEHEKNLFSKINKSLSNNS